MEANTNGRNDADAHRAEIDTRDWSARPCCRHALRMRGHEEGSDPWFTCPNHGRIGFESLEQMMNAADAAGLSASSSVVAVDPVASSAAPSAGVEADGDGYPSHSYVVIGGVVIDPEAVVEEMDMNFCLGNAFVDVWSAARSDGRSAYSKQRILSAIDYLKREVARREREG